MNKIDKFNDFIKKYNQYITSHNRLVKKCGFDSTILDVKVIPMTTLYKFFKELILKDNTQINDDNLILIIIYLLSDKLKLDLNKTQLLHDELLNTIPNFLKLKKRISLSLNNLLIISNMVCKKTEVINNFEKFLNLIDIPRIIDNIHLFTKEQKIGLSGFSFIIVNGNEKVLNNIVKFVNKKTQLID